jgi:hypothetical protein
MVVLTKDFKQTPKAISTISVETNLSPKTIHFNPQPNDTPIYINYFEPITYILLAKHTSPLHYRGNPSQMMKILYQRWNYIESTPLGKHSQGISKPIQAILKLGKEGLLISKAFFSQLWYG